MILLFVILLLSVFTFMAGLCFAVYRGILRLTQEDPYQDWVRALLSGRYKQGFNQLMDFYDGEAVYCCLGVACDLVLPKINGEWYRKKAYCSNSDIASMFLPIAVATYLKLTYQDPLVRHCNKKSLSNLNDAGYSFSYIASILSEQEDFIRNQNNERHAKFS